MEPRITDALERHIPALKALEDRCFSLPWTEEQLRSQLPDEHHVFLCAEDEDGRLLGYVGMMHVLDEGYVSNVAVDPLFRRQGVGDRLIRSLVERCKALGLSFVTLEVREHNEPAIRLYGRHGFLPVGRRKHYYERPVEDAILMTKILANGDENR